MASISLRDNGRRCRSRRPLDFQCPTNFSISSDDLVEAPASKSPRTWSSAPTLHSPGKAACLTSRLRSTRPIILSPTPSSRATALPRSSKYTSLSTPTRLLPRSSGGPTDFSCTTQYYLSNLFPILHLPNHRLTKCASPTTSTRLRIFRRRGAPPVMAANFWQ